MRQQLHTPALSSVESQQRVEGYDKTTMACCGNKKRVVEEAMTPLADAPTFVRKRSVSQLAVPHHEDIRRRQRVLFCIVLPAKGKKQAEIDAYRHDLMRRLVDAGLGVTLFYSVQEDEVLVKVAADDERLLQEADVIEFTIALDPNSMRTVAESEADKMVRAPIYLLPPYDPSEKYEERTLLSAMGEAMGVPEAQRLGAGWQKMTPHEIEHHMVSTMNPFVHLHARYNDEWEHHHLEVNKVQIYKTYSDGSILRTGDRMKLIQIIMERSINEDKSRFKNKGAGLNLSLMVIKKQALACFPFAPSTSLPLHEKTIEELLAEWHSWAKLPWVQPLDDIRDYFGEKIALYFAFLGHYTMWLFASSIFGLAVFFHQLYEISNAPSVLYENCLLTNTTGECAPLLTESKSFFDSTAVVLDAATGRRAVRAFTEVPEAALFALFMAFWASFMLEFWKRQQSFLALKWGTSNFEAKETLRPEFKPTHYLPSQITGKAEAFYSPRTFQVKVTMGLIVIFFCVMLVVAVIGAVFVFKVFVTLDDPVTGKPYTGISETNGTYLALVINAVAIQVMGLLYKSVAKALNDWENHKTDTAYEDALITKTFLFCFCNSYATLFYMAYVKSGTAILGKLQACEPRTVDNNTSVIDDACFGQLGVSLLIIFILQIVLNNTLEIVIPTITTALSRRSNLKVKKEKLKTGEAPVKKEIKMRSPAEDMYFLKSYEGTFDDYLEIALQFGYVTLFVAAFPLAPFLAFLNNVIEIRVDSSKLCKLSRRPINMGAQDIGTWQYIFYIMGLAAVLSNAAVIFFTSHIVRPPAYLTISGDAFRIWMWVISVFLVLFCKFLVDFALSDVPTNVKIQLERQEYLVRKCLALEPDDDDPEATKDEPEVQAKKPGEVNFTILKIDPYVESVIRLLAELILKDSSFDPEAAFKAADKSRDGKVSVAEFSRLLKGVGGVAGKVTTSELEMIAAALDSNGNGYLDYSEFVAFVKSGGSKEA